MKKFKKIIKKQYMFHHKNVTIKNGGNKMNEAWKNFKEGKWTTEINVQDFIKNNYKSYEGDESFLEEKTEKTTKIWNKCSDLLKE